MSNFKNIKKIKLLILDVDGVLTDGSIIYFADGDEYKIFNVKDGLGIHLAQRAGIKIAIITGRSSKAVDRRARELDIQLVYQNHKNKIPVYEQIKKDLQLKDEEIAYIGDDLTDLAVMQQVGFSVAVNDAAPDVKVIADYVTEKSGGQGAVRELIEMILKEQGLWEQATQKYHKQLEE